MLAAPYDFNGMIKLGLLPAAASSSTKLKFITYNADLTVLYISFVENTFIDSTTNALFFPYFGAYRWVTAYGCHFLLKQ